MEWKVEGERGESYSFTPDKLLELLFKASMDKDKEVERKGSIELVGVMAKTLASTQVLLSHTLTDILLVAFNVGYYYARFRYLNEVEIVENNKGNTKGV